MPDRSSKRERREPNRFLRNYVKQWKTEDRQSERERDRVAYSPLYTYIEKFQRLCSDPGNWSASIHDRDWCGECNFLRPRRRRLSSDAPFPYDPPPPPSRANSRICINTIGFRRGNSSGGRRSGAKLTKVCRQSYYPIPAPSLRIFDIDSAVERKTFTSGKQQRGGGGEG